MSILAITGPIARLDHPSADGRQLSLDGLTLPSAPVPLTALLAGLQPTSWGHFGAEPVGVINAWDLTDEGLLELAGDVYDDQRIPASTYPGGLEVRFEPGDAEMQPDERWPETGLLIVRKWSPIGVALHMPGSLGRNAFPDLPLLTVALP